MCDPATVAAGVQIGGSLIGGLMGGGSEEEVEYVPPGFNAGGLKASFSQTANGYKVKSSKERTGLVRSLAESFPEHARALGELRKRVTPGFGDLTRARLGEIENARVRSMGNLKENLSRRRVFGSSFGQAAIASSDLAFAQEAEKARAESFLQELEMTHGLINEEFNTGRQYFTTHLDELNLQADIAAKLTGNATGALAEIASLKMQQAQSSAAGMGKFFGDISAQAGKFAGSLFSPGAQGSWATTVTPA